MIIVVFFASLLALPPAPGWICKGEPGAKVRSGWEEKSRNKIIYCTVEAPEP